LYTDYNLFRNIHLSNNKVLRELNSKKRQEDVNHFFKNELPRKTSYTIRDGQILMAIDIVEAMSENANLMIEAGVGIGKSYAYLIPLLFEYSYSNINIVIATSSIILQKQIEDDICKLLKIMPHIDISEEDIIIAKGKTRYICINRLLNYKGNNKEIAQLKHDINSKEISISEAERQFMEVDSAINVKYCEKRKCKNRDKCSFYKMREAAKDIYDPKIVITNHDMFIQDRIMKQKSYSTNSLFGKTRIVVFDEAHNLEDKIRNAFLEVYNQKKIKIISDKLLKNERISQELEIVKNLDILSKKVNQLSNLLYKNITLRVTNYNENEKPLRLSLELNREEEYLLQGIKDGIEKIINSLRFVDGNNSKYFRTQKTSISEDTINDFIRDLERIHNHLCSIISANENFLNWLEFNYNRDGSINYSSIEIHTSIRHIGEQFNKLVLSDTSMTSILTSATLSTSDSHMQYQEAAEAYEYIYRSLGYDGESVDTWFNDPIESPYNYKENMMIYIDKDMPIPSGGNHHLSELVEGIKKSLSLTNGRTLILFTSKNDMHYVYDRLKKEQLEYKIFVQKNNNTKVLESFQTDETSILLSTGSFWEGINVPGKSLSQVIIARLPFPVPDPITEDKKKRHENQHGKNSYMKDILVPEMIIKLRQGIGRLIRKEDDFGIITILDSRISSKSKSLYKKQVLNSLPTTVTEDINVAQKFISNLEI
jgi:ATP-dependent DNA helicase DinG